jgi:toxin ParE1/3/4
MQIWEYIADDSEAQADNFINRVNRQFELIMQHSAMGRARDELASSLRSFPFERYVIFYIATSYGIDVVRILHDAQDVAAQFRTTRD